MSIQIQHKITSIVLHTVEADTLVKADLRGLNLEYADLRGLDLRGANFTDTILRWADLSEANLEGAILKGADVRWSHLRGTNLTETDVRETDFSRADMRWAVVEDADIRGANLRAAYNYRALPVVDPRGHHFHAIYTTEWRVRVGHEDFSIAEAREHWGEDYEGPEQIRLFMPAALDWLETQGSVI